MAKTILRVRLDSVAFYLNEVSVGVANSGKRYALSRTSQHSGNKDGWVRVNSTECKALSEIVAEADLFKACSDLFASKKLRPHVQHGGIRGMAGKWEGEAFPARATKRA
ncbi:hypothetical protein AABC73_20710 [Pseudomonas sp. G.S.17]|uniref:hypothetical protein n=1 Tax=Pseudomonas sp. G.S.17 TaxID=3137451 RepID=UPI00311CD7CD